MTSTLSASIKPSLWFNLFISSNKIMALNYSMANLVWSSSSTFDGPELIVDFLSNSSNLDLYVVASDLKVDNWMLILLIYVL